MYQDLILVFIKMMDVDYQILGSNLSLYVFGIELSNKKSTYSIKVFFFETSLRFPLDLCFLPSFWFKIKPTFWFLVNELILFLSLALLEPAFSSCQASLDRKETLLNCPRLSQLISSSILSFNELIEL